uniref:Uncharacterized protein n=1 Tax=Sphenodon punctatus TaxID=8508 RepID=A0A8D0HBS8_SPHPU
MALADPVKNLQEVLICSICLDYFKDPVILKCGHNFCRGCIAKCSEESRACPECRQPFQGEEFQLNRYLRSVVEITKKMSFQGTKGLTGETGRECEEHKEALKLFCEVDQTLICLVCRESRAHKAHSVAPIAEAAKDYKDQIQSRLEILKEGREEILAWKAAGETEVEEQLKKTDTERQKTVAEFKQLHQFLEEQERLLLAQLEDLDKEIVKSRDEYVAELSKEIASLGDLISEMEEKCRQPVSEFLQVR